MKKLILIGGGGHCKVVMEALSLCREFTVAGIVDKKEKVGKKVSGVLIIGEDGLLEEYFKKRIRHCLVTVGSIACMDLRIKLFNRAKRIGFSLPSIVHPRAIVSKSASIGEGSYIGAGAVINPGVMIGDNCIINTGSIVEHDCVIAAHVHIAPGVAMSGGVRIGEGTHIGTGSSVKQYVNIGKNVVVGVGSVVVGDIADNLVVCGNPCRVMKK